MFARRVAIVVVSEQLQEIMTKVKRLSNALDKQTTQVDKKKRKRTSRELTDLLSEKEEVM